MYRKCIANPWKGRDVNSRIREFGGSRNSRRSKGVGEERGNASSRLRFRLPVGAIWWEDWSRGGRAGCGRFAG